MTRIRQGRQAESAAAALTACRDVLDAFAKQAHQAEAGRAAGGHR